jgi:hypothetical protein
MESGGTIQIYSPFNPSMIQFELYDDYWPLNASQSQLLTYSYTNEIVTITVPGGRGLFSLSKNTPTPSNGGGNPSGSSGGGITPEGEGRIYMISEDQLNEGYLGDLSKGEEINFLIGEETHGINLNFLTSFSATIIVSSEPQTATFLSGDERRFELTGDNSYDLYVKLESIENNKANFLLKSISEPISEETTIEEKRKEEIALKELNKKFASSLRNFLYVLSILIIIMIFLIIFLRKQKRKSIKRKVIAEKDTYSL